MVFRKIRVSKGIKEMGKEEQVKFMNKLFKKINLEIVFEKSLWSRSSPRCVCDNCGLYENWLEWGRVLCKEDMGIYLKRVREEEIHREQMLSSRKIEKRKPYYSALGDSSALTFG